MGFKYTAEIPGRKIDLLLVGAIRRAELRILTDISLEGGQLPTEAPVHSDPVGPRFDPLPLFPNKIAGSITDHPPDASLTVFENMSELVGHDPDLGIEREVSKELPFGSGG
jgi:hypothetical protein